MMIIIRQHFWRHPNREMDRNDYHHDKVGKQTNKQNSQMQKTNIWNPSSNKQTNEKIFFWIKEEFHMMMIWEFKQKSKIEIRFFFWTPYIGKHYKWWYTGNVFCFPCFCVIDFLITGKKIYRLIMMKWYCYFVSNGDGGLLIITMIFLLLLRWQFRRKKSMTFIDSMGDWLIEAPMFWCGITFSYIPFKYSNYKWKFSLHNKHRNSKNTETKRQTQEQQRQTENIIVVVW